MDIKRIFVFDLHLVTFIKIVFSTDKLYINQNENS